MCSITERKHLKEKKLALKFFSLRNWKDEFPCIVIQRLREKGFGGKTRSLFGDTLNLRCLLDVDVLISCSVMAHSLRPHGLQPSRLLCPWNSPGLEFAQIHVHFLLTQLLPVFSPKQRGPQGSFRSSQNSLRFATEMVLGSLS